MPHKPSPEQLRDRILSFLAACKNQRPVLKEESGEIMPIEPGAFSVEAQHGKVLLEVWDESRSVVRRIMEVKREAPTELVLAYRRFGAGEGVVRILASSKRAPELRREVARGRFAERLRKLLALSAPGWRVEQLSAERDLERSLSAQAARALLTRGQQAWAVVGCAEEEGEAAAAAALTQGLAWLECVRHSARVLKAPPGKPPQRLVAGLKLFLPERFVAATALRWPFLNREAARFELFAFSPDDEIRPVEEADYGNLATELPPPLSTAAAPAEALELLRRLAQQPGVEMRVHPAAGLSCRIHGLELARAGPGGAAFGCGDCWQPLTAASLPEAIRLAGEITRLRSPDSPDRHHPFYTAQPERWLESLLLRRVGVLSGELHPGHVYSQVPAVAGRERGVIDLLGVTRSGRLAVMELKVAADPNLPLQALDYWMRVKWHLERGEFQRLGYFPGIQLRSDPPWLWLVAPAYEFHPLTDVVLRYLSPEVPIRRFGLNETWREAIQVVYRG